MLHIVIGALDECVKEVYTASLFEEEALMTLCYWLYCFMLDDDPEIREKVVKIWKVLLQSPTH